MKIKTLIMCIAMVASSAFAAENTSQLTGALSGTEIVISNPVTSAIATSFGGQFIESVSIVSQTGGIITSNFEIAYREIDTTRGTNDYTLLEYSDEDSEVYIPSAPIYWGVGDAIKITSSASNDFYYIINYRTKTKN